MGILTDILPHLVVIAVVATVVILFAGVIVMAIGGDTDRRLANPLMRARVGMQGVAVAVLVLLHVISVA